jgi:hypothetical protein
MISKAREHLNRDKIDPTRMSVDAMLDELPRFEAFANIAVRSLAIKVTALTHVR